MAAASRSKSEIADDDGHLTPGAHLRAEIERLGLDQVAVSKATGVSRQSINNIINGRQPISRAMAGKLGRLTGRSSDYWLSAFFDNKGARREANEPAIGGVLVNHQIIHAVKTGILGITPFDSKNVRAAAIDLTLGRSLTLAPGAMAAARTRERIELPLDYVARVGVADTLVGSGVFASHRLHLEPGFKGAADFCLYNAGKKALALRTRQPVIRLEIIRLGAAADL